METQRLILRKNKFEDFERLHNILQKPEVMYAWEHGFTEEETRMWIEKQIERYNQDGCGYLMAELKETHEAAGQIGILKTTLNGESVFEVGYILDNAHWHKGLAVEGARGCLNYAFCEMKVDTVYCTIRPKNIASILVAERLGFKRAGEFVKLYDGKEMPHLIFTLSKEDFI